MQVYNHELYHYGVLGMKWGRHKPSSGSDKVVKVGTKVHNISRNDPRTSNHVLYGSYKNRDNLNYRSYYAKQLKKYGASKVFDNTFEVTKDIVIPSEKKAMDSFVKVYKEDPRGIARELANAKVKTTTYLSIGKFMRINVEDAQFKKYSKMGEKQLRASGFNDFIKTMPLLDKSRDKYFNSLIKEGYSGVTDYHDIKEFGSKDPIIIFKGDDNLKRTSSIEISPRDMNLALSEYENIRTKESINKLIGRNKNY